MPHYFTNQDTPYTPYMFKDYILDNTYTFYGAEGVFSKDKVDFGSKVLIKALAEIGNVSGSMIDIGAGYGALSLVLASINPNLAAELIDVNERAIALAKKNIDHFNLQDRLSASVFDLNKSVSYKSSAFNYALTNPPIRAGKKTVQRAFDLAYNSLKEGGKLYVVIQKKQGAASAKDYIKALFGSCEIISKSSGYYILYATKS